MHIKFEKYRSSLSENEKTEAFWWQSASPYSLARLNLAEEIKKKSKVFIAFIVSQGLLPMNSETDSTGQWCWLWQIIFHITFCPYSEHAMSYSRSTCKLQCDIKLCVSLVTSSFYIF